jgi:chlorobactene glucosyltransferase
MFISIIILLFGSFSVLTTMFIRLFMAFHDYRITRRYTAALDAPSVSVCIPARNEMHALIECLERLVVSTYPKLEIIVIDDESQDDTSVIIKSFAHEGVRFVAGGPLPKDWLGKNYALDVLSREASGTYIIFMDVDTFTVPTTISELVGFAMTENVDMVSIIPRRNDTYRTSVFFGTLRYFWQLVGWKQQPAVSGALWMIKRTTLLDNFNGIKPFKMTVDPEVNIAAALGEKYKCLVGNDELGVSYEKKWRSQIETNRRLLYPFFGATPWSGIKGCLLLISMNLPTFIVLTGVFGWATIHTIAAGVVVAWIIVYGYYLSHVWRTRWWLGALLWPVVALQEFYILLSSIWGYARGTITWKGRPVAEVSSYEYIKNKVNKSRQLN